MLWKDQIREWKDEAREDGLAEGRAEGMEEGKVIGLKEGAKNKAIEATKNLLKMNLLTVEQIAAAEQLSIEEVIKIKDSLQK